jgi:diguanylate cyclase (GGDEF)-like protein
LEKLIANVLHLIRLDPVGRKILVFSLVATLIPSLSMGWLFYAYAKQFITEKTAQKLIDVTAQDVRELDLWLKERVYEVRVFASSYEVSENLEKIAGAGSAPGGKERAIHRLNDYLESVGEKFNEYEELLVMNTGERIVAASADKHQVLNLPDDWQQRARTDTPIIGRAYRDAVLDKMVMLLAVPIKSQDSRLLGVLAVKLNFSTLEEILGRSLAGQTGKSYMIARDGTVIAGSRLTSDELIKIRHPFDAVQMPDGSNTALQEYSDGLGEDVIGVFHRMTQLDGGVVAQIGKKEIYAQIMQIRILTLVICLCLLLFIGLSAYLLGLTIVRPLDRLARGAADVAAGDLSLELPVISRGEVGYLTEAFNNMVARLRQGQEELAAINGILTEKNKELEVLSVTDGLTGLHNRKYFMEALNNELVRARRHNHPFVVMMMDTDHFKKYNDTFGHPAGDALLKKIGEIFRESLRAIDYASRYGGDEFIVLLPEAGKEESLAVAERIRRKVAAAVEKNDSGEIPVTISIGVAAFPEHGDTPEAIIGSADGALYRAKRNGRNQVVVAGGDLQPDVQAAPT